MQEVRFLFYVLWQAPCARNFYRQRYSVAVKRQAAQARRGIYLERVEILQCYLRQNFKSAGL